MNAIKNPPEPEAATDSLNDAKRFDKGGGEIGKGGGENY